MASMLDFAMPNASRLRSRASSKHEQEGSAEEGELIDTTQRAGAMRYVKTVRKHTRRWRIPYSTLIFQLRTLDVSFKYAKRRGAGR